MPTPNFGGSSPLTDTADLGHHQFPSQGVQVWWFSNKFRQFVWGERSPVPASMYAMLDSAGQQVGVVKFVMGQVGVQRVGPSVPLQYPNPAQENGLAHHADVTLWPMAGSASGCSETIPGAAAVTKS